MSLKTNDYYFRIDNKNEGEDDDDNLTIDYDAILVEKTH